VAIRFGRASIGLAGISAALALAAGIALADTAPVRIDYRAEPGCPGAAAFLDAVSALTPNARLPAASSPARRFTVRIARAGSQLVGRLRIEEIDGVGAEREVTGPTCDDVVGALALVTALAIDAGPIDAPIPSASAPPSAPAPPPIASASARPAASSASVAPPPPPPPPTTSADPPPPPRPPSPWKSHFELGAAVGAFGAVSPSLAWGGSVFADWSGWGSTAFTPSVRLGVAVAQSPPVEAGAGRATFRLVALRFAGCPWALKLGPIVARPCGSLDFGALHGVGSALFETFGQTRTWADFAVGPRLQWRVGRALVIEGEIALLLPLIRDTFIFEEPMTVIHEVPYASAAASLGVGWLLP